jgi:hypothetical protein
MVAAVAYWSEIKRRRRSQASQVRAWVAKARSGIPGEYEVHVLNRSDEPIFYVELRSMLAKLQSLRVDVVPPGEEWIVPAAEEVMSQHSQFGIELDLEFNDGLGRRWKRVAGSPVEKLSFVRLSARRSRTRQLEAAAAARAATVGEPGAAAGSSAGDTDSAEP